MKTQISIFIFVLGSGIIAPAQNTSFPIRAWGAEEYGRTNIPSMLTNVIEIAVGYYHSMALTADGRVVAWGQGNDGQTNVPSTLTNVVAIAAGAFHSLAVTKDGRVVGWGYTNNGSCNAPADVTNFTAVACGLSHSLGLTSDGRVIAWGDNGLAPNWWTGSECMRHEYF